MGSNHRKLKESLGFTHKTKYLIIISGGFGVVNVAYMGENMK